jgi:hypothetical protein
MLWKLLVDLSSSGLGWIEGYYNNFNENSGSLKEREFLAKERLLVTERLCSVELNKDIKNFLTFPSKSFVNFSWLLQEKLSLSWSRQRSLPSITLIVRRSFSQPTTHDVPAGNYS